MKDETKKTLDWIKEHKMALSATAAIGTVAIGALCVRDHLFGAYKYRTIVSASNKAYIDDIINLVNFGNGKTTPFAFSIGCDKKQTSDFFNRMLETSPDNSTFCVMLERLDK